MWYVPMLNVVVVQTTGLEEVKAQLTYALDRYSKMISVSTYVQFNRKQVVKTNIQISYTFFDTKV